MPLWLADRPLVLASKSAVRHAILRDAGLPVEVVPADVDERAIEQRAANSDPPLQDASAIASLLAREKAQAVAARLPGRLVLGADQTLALGERRFSKPADIAAARAQLKSLRGKTHTLHSAVAFIRDGSVQFAHCEVAHLTMRDFSDDFLESYLAAAETSVAASVGAYQLERIGIQLFERVDAASCAAAILAAVPMPHGVDHMFILGLTGSVGMGKSTTAGLFADAGVPVHDADAVVHRLYEGPAVAAIEAAFPGTTGAGKVDRNKLAVRVLGDHAALERLEAIIHPLVQEAEAEVLARAQARGEKVVVLDIPLLFETGGDARVDAVVVVSAPEDVQRARVLARPGMTPEKLEAILAKQMPDAEKRRRADFVVDTSRGLDAARIQVGAILDAVATMPKRIKTLTRR